MPVVPGIAALLPGGGLRRGTVVRCTGEGGRSLALAVAAGPSAAGSWCGLVGMDDVGVLAVAGYGVDLDRFVVVRTAPAQWAVAAALLVEGLDLVVVSPPHPRPAVFRTLAARARDRGAVVLVVEERPSCPADLELAVVGSRWHGLGEGAGRLRSRRVTVVASGRGAAARPLRQELWLPAATGKAVGA